MNLNRQKAKPAEARSKARQQTALELRTANHSYSVIGEKMGISKSQAHRLVMDGLADLDATVKEAAERLRALELLRCDALTLKLWPQSANPRVCDSILRIMERRAKLLGLDAPAKAEISGTTGPIDVSTLSDAELEAIIREYQATCDSGAKL
jgi:hypothetical protein